MFNLFFNPRIFNKNFRRLKRDNSKPLLFWVCFTIADSIREAERIEILTLEKVEADFAHPTSF